MYKHTDPVKGELFQPLAVVPPLTVNTSPGIMLFRKNQTVTKNYISYKPMQISNYKRSFITELANQKMIPKMLK
jgi:hypothetical protein